MTQDVLANSEDKMKKAVEALRRDLTTIRTGRASPALIEHLEVDYHGATMPLNQLANISAPEPRLLVVQPWDKYALGPIEKAILKSDLGLNPTNDGRLVRIAIPQLSEERRRDLVKVVKRKVEEGRVAVRNIRRDAIEHLKELQKEKMISEDEEKKAQETIQKQTDKYVAAVEHVGEAKEVEILQV
jgi:ribosome recycling factor